MAPESTTMSISADRRTSVRFTTRTRTSVIPMRFFLARRVRRTGSSVTRAIASTGIYDVQCTGPMGSVTFETHPSHYRHWRLDVQGAIATLALDVAEDGGLEPGYALKLNSYDLGVDVELADAIQRLRFSHPAVRVLVVTSQRDRVFSAGANILMLGQSTHAFKVNFCKFTNETRLHLEEMSREAGIATLAALNATASGGGYEQRHA